MASSYIFSILFITVIFYVIKVLYFCGSEFEFCKKKIQNLELQAIIIKIEKQIINY